MLMKIGLIGLCGHSVCKEEAKQALCAVLKNRVPEGVECELIVLEDEKDLQEQILSFLKDEIGNKILENSCAVVGKINDHLFQKEETVTILSKTGVRLYLIEGRSAKTTDGNAVAKKFTSNGIVTARISNSGQAPNDQSAWYKAFAEEVVVAQKEITLRAKNTILKKVSHEDNVFSRL